MPFGLHLENIAPTAVYVGGIAAFIASARKRPHIGIYYIVPLLPLQSLRYRLHDYVLGAQWIDLMLLGILIGIWRNGYTLFPPTPLTRLLRIFAVFTYLSLWWGVFHLNTGLPLWFDDPRLSDWKNYMVIFLFFFATLASIRDVKQMKVLLFLMVVSILFLNRAYIHTVSGRDFSHFSYDVRDSGGMGYAGVNGLAAFEAQFSVFLLALYSLHKVTTWKIGSLIILGTCLYCLLYTLSRGAYISFIVGTLFVGLLTNRKLVLVLGVFLITWQSIVPPAVSERVFMTKTEDGELDPSAGDRVLLWENALQIFRGDPIFGTGFDTYAFMHAVGPYRDTHNVYVKVMLETGILGLLLFLCIFATIFQAGLRLFRRTECDGFMRGLGCGLAGLMIATAIGNFFGDRWTYIEMTGYTLVIMAMVIRCHFIADQTAPESMEAFDLEVVTA